jgi:hypothetical protein
MRCRDVEKLCSGYVDGEIDDRVASALRGHLRTCDACRALVEDEAAIRDAAAGMEPLEPPPGMWSAVEARLAQAEIADSERSRAWLWWQGLRRHALPAAVAAAAVLVFVVWNSRRDDGESNFARPEPGATRADEQAEISSAGNDRAKPPRASFLETREREVLEADATYLSVIAELDAVVKVEREGWAPQTLKSFDARLGDLRGNARRYARELAFDEMPEPSSRDALYAAYSAQIGHMQHAVLEEMLK